jgi:hypothetical protein
VILVALNLDSLQSVTGEVGFVALPNVGYSTKCRSVGDRVEFQIVDCKAPNVVIARAIDSSTDRTPRKEIDMLMAPFARVFTDDR